MSTLPPSMRRVPANAPVTSVKMASAKMGKSKTTMKASATDGVSKTKSQMHRRSRSGCYTCRLRRKKCDELTPFCSACQHLGLECEYKRPVWWSNNEARRRNKEDIKIIIKRKKLAEKSATHEIHSSVSPPPPSLSHSMHTSASGSSDFYDDRNRSASIDSRASGGGNYYNSNNFNSPPSGADFVAYNSQIHPDFIYGVAAAAAGGGGGGGGGYSPYEIDVKTERQMYVNDVPTVRESHVSTFSTMHTPPPPGIVLPAGSFSNGWTGHHHVHEERNESLSEEALNVNFFDFAHGPPQESRMLHLELDDGDKYLFDHFIKYVMPIIFPILDCNQHGSVGSNLILPAMNSNSIYLHCCLSTAAQHVKTASLAAAGQAPPPPPADEVGDPDGDIMRHRYATIWSLCEALKRDENHQQILEATLGLIFFQCVVGRPDDGLLDIAWHQHFQAAISLVQKLDLPRLVSNPSSSSSSVATQLQHQQQQQPLVQTPFNMTLTAWIDILGGTMLGQSPQFAHTYREKHLSDNPHLGLRELMGCEDRVMYLISEIACLEALKKAGMDDFVLCQHVSSLGEQMSLTEVGGDNNNNNNNPRLPFNANGTLSPKQLSKNMTSAFRIAARIYLCSLVPGFNPFQHSPASLVDRLTAVLQCIPAGPQGFDRSLVWVYLMCGSISAPDSPFRALFEQRIAALGEQAQCGSFGRMVVVMRELWLQNDQLLHASTPGSDVAPRYVHWREILQMNGWDYLLI